MIINSEVYFVMIISVASAVFAQYFIKKLTVFDSITRALGIMFFLCAVLATAIGWLFGPTLKANMSLVGLGFLNALTAWLWWRAIKVSLSQTMLFLPLTGFVGVLLTALFLKEWYFLNPQTISGILNLVGALGLLGSIWFFHHNQTENKKVRRIWLWCIFGQSVLGGVIVFLMKYFALQGVAKTDFIFSWYLGAFIGSFFLLILEKDLKIRLSQKGLWLSYLLLSAATLVSVLTNYWSLELAPATLVLPLSQFFTILGSALVGLLIFCEKKSFSFFDWIGVAVGFVSMVLLIGGMGLIR